MTSFDEFLEAQRERMRAVGMDDYLTAPETGLAEDAWDACVERHRPLVEAARGLLEAGRATGNGFRGTSYQFPSENVRAVRAALADLEGDSRCPECGSSATQEATGDQLAGCNDCGATWDD